MSFKKTELGIIPQEWGIYKVNEYTEIVTDYVANGSFASLKNNVQYYEKPNYAVLLRLTDYNNNFNGNFVFIDKNGYEFLNKTKLYGGEIIISNVGAGVGTVFKAPVLDYKMNLGPNSIMLKTKGYDSFYYYWFKSRNGQQSIKSILSGSAQPKFNKTSFRNLYLPVPPLEEQKAIAKILSDLDEKIETNNKINKKLEEMAQAIFKQWFVDFDFPNEEGKPYKSSGGEMVESELGLIPEGWSIRKLVDVCTKITDGSHFSPKHCENGEYPMLSVKDMDNNGFNYKECKKIDKENFEKMVKSDCVPRKNDILVAKDGSYLKHIFIINEERKEAILSSIAIFRPDVNVIYPEELLYMLKNPILQKKVKENYVSGSALPRIVLKDFKNFKVTVPPLQTQNDIQVLLTVFRKQIANNVSQNKKLIKVRDLLLPKLMNGEIRVLLNEK